MSEHEHAGHGHEAGQGQEHGGGHAASWGDYNARDPGTPALPAVSALALSVFGAALASMLLAIAFYSFKVLNGPGPAPEVHGTGTPEPVHEPDRE